MGGLLGFRKQGMDGGRRGGSRSAILADIIDVVGAGGSYTVPKDYLTDIFAWAGGGSGNSTGGGNTCGGGGGAAGYSRVLIPKGATITWTGGQSVIGASPGASSGNNGSNTAVSVLDLTMTAQGGRGGVGSGTGAARSTATGFQVNRYGGGTFRNAGGEAGEYGALAAPGTFGGGGGGGFTDMFPNLTGARGGNSVGGGASGAQIIGGVAAGSGSQTDGSQYSPWAGPTRVLLLFYQV